MHAALALARPLRWEPGGRLLLFGEAAPTHLDALAACCCIHRQASLLMASAMFEIVEGSVLPVCLLRNMDMCSAEVACM